MAEKDKDKMYIVRKYVKAGSVAEVLRKEHKTAVHEVYIDDKWQEKHLADAIGF